MVRGDNILWRATAEAFDEAPALDGNITTDVAIVGGGFTGLSAALHLAKTGAVVCLLEAETVGFGGSGRNVGLVNAGLWTPPDGVEETLGVIAGTKLNDILAAGPDLVFSLIETHGIDCEAVRVGTLHCADSKAGLADLENRFQQQKKRGAPVELLNATLTAKRTGTRRFQAALLDHRAGTIQPLAYARGLAVAAVAAGARLHENSRVRRIRNRSGAWQLETTGGTVVADRLIIATNAYAIRPALPRRGAFTTVHYFQLATEPVAEEVRASMLPGREGCWDTGKVMSSFRFDAAGRLILGSVGSVSGFGSKWNLNWARRKLRWLYPQIAASGFEYTWQGRIAMTADHMPKIIDFGPNAISLFGYSGRGIAPGTVFGKAAAEWAVSGDPERLPVMPQGFKRESFTPIKRMYYGLGAAASHLIGTRRGL